MAKFRLTKNPNGTWTFVGYRYSGKELVALGREDSVKRSDLRAAATRVAQAVEKPAVVRTNV